MRPGFYGTGAILPLLLALSTQCAPADWPLDRVLSSLRDLGVRGWALHRPPTPAELRRLPAPLRVVAVFGEAPAKGLDAARLVVEGGPAGEDREASLLALLRRLHALRPLRVGLLPPLAAGDHPAADEIEVVCSDLAHVGYWHDAARAGPGYLDAAGRRLVGASFDPRADVDLAGLRDALGRDRPAVVTCPPGTPRREVEEALRRARGVFRA